MICLRTDTDTDTDNQFYIFKIILNIQPTQQCLLLLKLTINLLLFL